MRIAQLLSVIDSDHRSRQRADWPERDRALVSTPVLAGLRADELMRANIGDIRKTDDGGDIQVQAKG